MRQYAREKLEAAGVATAWQSRHYDYFYGFVDAHWPRLFTGQRKNWLSKALAERENLRQALEWSFSEMASAEAGPELIQAISGYWPFAMQESVEWAARAVACCDSHPEVAPALAVAVLISRL